MLDRATTLIPKMSVAIEILQQRVDKLVQNVRVFEQTKIHNYIYAQNNKNSRKTCYFQL